MTSRAIGVQKYAQVLGSLAAAFIVVLGVSAPHLAEAAAKPVYVYGVDLEPMDGHIGHYVLSKSGQPVFKSLNVLDETLLGKKLTARYRMSYLGDGPPLRVTIKFSVTPSSLLPWLLPTLKVGGKYMPCKIPIAPSVSYNCPVGVLRTGHSLIVKATIIPQVLLPFNLDEPVSSYVELKGSK